MSDDIGEFVLAPENIAAFKYGETLYRIYAGLRNDTVGRHPRQWQFRYEPLFLPQVDQFGKLAITITDMGRQWQVQLPISLYTAETDRLAYKSVLKALTPSQAIDILPNNVTALNLSGVSLQIDNLTALIPQAKLSESSIDLLAMPASFGLDIYVPTLDDAKKLASILPNMRIDYQITFAAKAIQSNQIKINRADFRSSDLYAKLNGLGTTSVYVHRDDFRRLSEGMSTKIAVNAVIEAPEKFDQAFADRVLSDFGQTVTADLAAFGEQKWRSTYNGDDLKTDVITKELNKMFTKDETEEQWKYNGTFELGGKVGLLDVLTAESNVGATYSQESLKKKLEERNMEVSFEGNKILAKSLSVVGITLSQFEGNSELTSI